jgi:hypothetical protein
MKVSLFNNFRCDRSMANSIINFTFFYCFKDSGVCGVFDVIAIELE